MKKAEIIWPKKKQQNKEKKESKKIALKRKIGFFLLLDGKTQQKIDCTS